MELPEIGPLPLLEAGINSFYDKRDQSTIGLGVRWDFAENLALKGQVEQASSDAGVGVSFYREASSGAGDDDNVMLYSVTLDVVF